MTLLLDPPAAQPRVATRASRALGSLPACAVLLDLVLIVATCLVAVLARGGLEVLEPASGVPHSLAVTGPLLVATWLIALALVGSHQREIFGAGSDEFKRVVRGSTITAAAVGITCYLAKYDLSRGFFILAFAVGVPMLLVGRVALRVALRSARSRGALAERVLLSGTAVHVDEIATVLAREAYLGYRVVGALTDDGHQFTPGGVPVVGHVDDVHHAVRELDADVLFMADNSFGSSARLREIVYDLESDDVAVLVAPGVADISGRRVKMRPTGGLPLIHIEKPQTAGATRWAKRSFDVVGASMLLLAFAPILAMAAFRIWSHDRGPVFYSHTRVGKDGVGFGCLKFRTMVQNADALHAELVAAQGCDELLFKVKDDPRVTRPGRWLRKYSLDELPQLLNVLRGDMSLVGPRPQVAGEVALYRGHMQRRLLVRPGMTGLWQVSGRSDLSPEEAMRLDLFYVDNWSMVQDLAILMRTWKAVVGSHGAY
ncbi:MAG: Exopolysaccharide biosynthesis polyprenyl glycosylphosphotransferase [Nocardioides sp.]|nr:Exopolysaccharide biosynthesis polyprenyl glycosylphosphotransferase [Nocardioides sp.]